MRHLRGPQHHFVAIGVQQVNQAGIALRDLRRKSDNLTQHLIERQLGADNAADPMQERNMGTGRLHNTYRGHTSG